jgi:hypothetical protein
MTRPFQVPLFVLAAAAGASLAVAAETSPLLKDQLRPMSGVRKAPHVVSPMVAEKLAVSAPRYTPPPAAPAAAKSTEFTPELAPDLRETDKPRNGIIRLPDFVVLEDRPVKIKERDMLTPMAKVKLGYLRHPGLKFGNFLSFLGFNNDGIAAMLVEQELALERKREFYDLVSLLPPAQAKQAKAMADDAYSGKSFTGAR